MSTTEPLPDADPKARKNDPRYAGSAIKRLMALADEADKNVGIDLGPLSHEERRKLLFG